MFEQDRSIYRSGLFDSVVRVSVNLVGGEAMSLQQARERKWRQETLLGVSLKVVAPTGQYDPTKLINLGSNRWTFKPELGFSQAFGGHWVFDAYASAFFFTENPEFFSNNPEFGTGTQAQTQDPIGAVEVHLSYDVRPRLWVSLDGNFWYGGKTSLNGEENPSHAAEELPGRDHGLLPVHPPPVAEGLLRPGRLHPLRRRLQDLLGGLAVLLDRPSEVRPARPRAHDRPQFGVYQIGDV